MRSQSERGPVDPAASAARRSSDFEPFERLAQARRLARDGVVVEVRVSGHGDRDVAPGHVAVDAQDQQRLVVRLEPLAQGAELVLDVRALVEMRGGALALDELGEAAGRGPRQVALGRLCGEA